MVRIRKAVDSPLIARLPLGRSEAPAAVSPPPADPPLSRQAADAVPAGNDAAAAAPEKAVARSAASEGVASLSPPKKKQKTVRAASSRRNDIENNSFWREERQDDWRARAAAVNDGRSAGRSCICARGFFAGQRLLGLVAITSLPCSQEATAVCASERTASPAYALISFTDLIPRHRTVRSRAHVYPRSIAYEDGRGTS